MGSDLVAKLGTDNSAWDAGFKKAGGSLSSFASGIGGLIGPAVGALAGLWGAAESVGAYKESLEAQRKLSAVIEATGGAAGLTTSQITDFAAEMQTLTNFEDDATTGAAAALAAFTNIRGQTFTDTIESAMDLSTVMGGDLESNVKLLGKALNDPSEGFGKLAKAGIQFTDQQQNQIKAMQQSGDLLGAQNALLEGVQSKFGGAAMAVADPWKQLQNTFGDVAENIGSVLLPSINVVTSGINALLGPVVEAGDMFKDLGIEAAVVLENMGGLVYLSIEQWKLFGVQVGAEASHVFTEVFPAYLNWFGENWQEIFVTAASNTLTIFENLGTNLKSAWTAILNFFKTRTIEFDFKPLSDGFINTVSKLPDIPPRAIGELEQGLKDSVAAATESLGESMTASRERIAAEFNTESKVPSGTIAPEADAVHDKKDKSENKVALAGSQEAVKIAFAGLQPTKLEDLATKQLKETQDQTKLMKERKAASEDGEDIP